MDSTHEDEIAKMIALIEAARENDQPLTPHEVCLKHGIPELESAVEACLKRLDAFPNLDPPDLAETDGPEPNAVSIDLEGQQLGPFQIVNEIGRGGMGVVYKARDRERDVDIALKVMQRDSADHVRRFGREFRSLADLQHENLVRILERGVYQGRFFYTMEFVHGSDLLTYIRGTDVKPGAPLTNESAQRLRICLPQLADALNCIHLNHKLHLDIKPSNVLVTASPAVRVVVLDFGLTAPIPENEEYFHSQLIGTWDYLAPEQIQKLNATAATDWYAFGVVLFATLTGQVPFAAKSLPELVEKCAKPPPDPREVVPDVPDDLAELSLKLLDPDPRKRPQGHEVLALLSVAPTSSASRSAKTTDFVGRTKELTELNEAVQQMQQGHTAICVVHGKSGIGKTRLVKHFLDQFVGIEDFVVLSERCYQQDAIPFKAMDGLMGKLCDYLRKLANVERFQPTTIRPLLRVFPVLNAVAWAEQVSLADSTADVVELRRRAAGELRDLFGRLGTSLKGGLILVIDDLQWGDVDSARILADVLRPPRSSAERASPKLLLVVSYRRENLDTSPFTSPFLREFLQNREACLAWHEVAVEPLNDGDRVQLAEDLLSRGGVTSKALVEQVGEQSAGYPLFIEEMVKDILERNKLTLDGHQLSSATEEEKTNTLSAVLRRRIERLSSDERQLLEVLAVASRPIGVAQVYQAAKVTRGDDKAIKQLLDQKLARSIGAGRTARVRKLPPPIPKEAKLVIVETQGTWMRGRLFDDGREVWLPSAAVTVVEMSQSIDGFQGPIPESVRDCLTAEERRKDNLSVATVSKLCDWPLSRGAEWEVVENRNGWVRLFDDGCTVWFPDSSVQLVEGLGKLHTYHDSIREVVLENLTAEKHRQHHSELAKVLVGSPPEVLATHLRSAGHLDSAGEYFQKAAAEAAKGLAFERAASHYREALELQRLPPEETRKLRIRLGDVLVADGRGAEAAQEYLEASQGATQFEAIELQRRAASQLLSSGHFEAGEAALRKVLKTVGLKMPGGWLQTLTTLLWLKFRLRLKASTVPLREESEIPQAELAALDVCQTASFSLSVIHTIQASVFQSRSLLLALSARERRRLVLALGMEAVQEAIAGTKRSRRADKLMDACWELAKDLDDYHRAMVTLGRGVIKALAGDWPRAQELCDDANQRLLENRLREAHPGVMWEVGTSQRFALWPLVFMGELATIARRLPNLLDEARARDDLYGITNLCLVIRTSVTLARDQPEQARQELDEVMRRWARTGFHVQHMEYLYDQTQIDLYTGKAESAWKRLQEGWPLLKKSLFLNVQQVRVYMYYLRARAALAMAAKGTGYGRFLRSAEADSRRLWRENAAWSQALAQLIRASSAAIRGDRETAVRAFEDGAERCDNTSMKLYAASARYRLADLRGGEIDQSCWDKEGVDAPKRMVGLLLPGCTPAEKNSDQSLLS